MFKVLCVLSSVYLADIELTCLPELNAHVNSVCEKVSFHSMFILLSLTVPLVTFINTKGNICLEEFLDHVYLVHPSTDISVDISTDSRPTYRSTYQPTLDRRIGQHIGRVSTDMSVDISVECRSICRPRCVARYIGRHIARALVDMSTDTRPICRSICRPRVVVRLSADMSIDRLPTFPDTSLLLAYW